MKNIMIVLIAIAFSFGFMSCADNDPGVNPIVTDVVISAPATQLGDTVLITKTVSYDIVPDEVTSFTHTVTTIGLNTVPAVTVDGVISNTVDVSFDVDFANTAWANDNGIGDVLLYEFNGDASEYVVSANGIYFPSFVSVSFAANGIIDTDDTDFTYSTFTVINDGSNDFTLQ